MEKLDNFIHNNELVVESFLKKKGVVIDDLYLLSKKWNNYFLRSDNMLVSDLISYLSGNSYYIEGVVCIWAYGKEVISFKHWDLIDQLWCYFIDALYQLFFCKKNEIIFSFPDQPLEVKLKRSGDKLFLYLDNNLMLEVAEDIFVNVFLKAGINFLTKLKEALNTDVYKPYIKMTNDILNYMS